jgi:hypothetical protein
MDPLSILSLVGTCTSIATSVISAIRTLDELISKARTPDRPASRLTAQLRLFKATVDELKTWLNKAAIISPVLKSVMRTTLRDCEDVISDIEDHVRRVAPKRGDGSTLIENIKLRWNERAIQDYERMLGVQFQTFDLFTRLLSL